MCRCQQLIPEESECDEFCIYQNKYKSKLFSSVEKKNKTLKEASLELKRTSQHHKTSRNPNRVDLPNSFFYQKRQLSIHRFGSLDSSKFEFFFFFKKADRTQVELIIVFTLIQNESKQGGISIVPLAC